MLTPCPGQVLPSKGSKQIILFDCSCGGKSVPKIWKNFANGHTKNCGRCNILTAEHLSTAKFGKLRMKDPEDTLPHSNKKTFWICDCGKEAFTKVHDVTSGLTSSCGKCNQLTAEHLSATIFGKLRMKDPVAVNATSHRPHRWLCDCGRETTCSVFDVVRGSITSCGRCDFVPASHFEANKFGKLRLRTPQELDPTSERLETWVCDCGKVIRLKTSHVVNGDITECGKCRVVVKEKPVKEKFVKAPKSPKSSALKGADLVIDELKISQILRPSTPYAREEISAYVNHTGFETELQYELNGWKYDVYVPSNNLLIAYQGLESEDKHSKRRNIEKYRCAVDSGHQLVLIFEDEWLYNEHKVKYLIKNKLAKTQAKAIRPKACDIQLIDSVKADRFYESFHYIGKAKAKINYGVFYDSELIGCSSFKNPTRQSTHKWELVRMASNPAFKVHGIWSKIMGVFSREYPSPTIVSFSDNRLFTGGVYEKIGFSFDGIIPADYYWCRDLKRSHKSGLRKKGEERTGELTEIQLRTAQGYHRVWDLGKKRWIFRQS